MTMVRAKFKVWSVKQHIDKDGAVTGIDVELGAVTSGSEENKAFWQYTPSGQIKMTITNPAVFDFFRPDMEFYSDFTPAVP